MAILTIIISLINIIGKSFLFTGYIWSLIEVFRVHFLLGIFCLFTLPVIIFIISQYTDFRLPTEFWSASALISFGVQILLPTALLIFLKPSQAMIVGIQITGIGIAIMVLAGIIVTKIFVAS